MPIMTMGLMKIAAKARNEQHVRFTSLAHHVTKELLWDNLNKIPNRSAPGVDKQDVISAKENFESWAEECITSIHRQGYKPPAIRRVYIPKPGKTEMRPIGIPTIFDRCLQRTVSQVMAHIYEQDFLSCSFGVRPRLSAHHALCTLNEIIAGKKIGWVFEADLKNFFGSLSHEWLLRFVEHRVGDQRFLSLIRRWLKAGVMEGNNIIPNESGTPQGGSISVILSNIYLHYVLDLWFEKVVKPRLGGECYLVRYIDDFVVCFQYRADAVKFREVLVKRLSKFSLQLEMSKTKLIEFGRFSQRHAKERGRRQETFYFLGFTHFCTRNRAGNFQIGRRTEKSRFSRSLTKVKELISKVQHWRTTDQMREINQILRGHFAYYGLGGNLRALIMFYREVEKFWKYSFSRRCWKSKINWEVFHKIKEKFPLHRPKLSIPYTRMKSYAVL
jgi:group II intron reverse transcriptase/maturase